MDNKKTLWINNKSVDKKFGDYRNSSYLCSDKRKNEIRVVSVRSGYSSKKIPKTGTVSLVNGGPHPWSRTAAMPVDYNDGEHPNLMQIGVFITITIRPFFIFFSPFAK